MAVRVLVVDDEPDLLDLVHDTLVEGGYAVETAASGREALDALSRRAPDLVVLDLMLPGRDGFENRGRYGDPEFKPRVFQLMMRLYGNENETRKKNGTLAENGCGKFSFLNPARLKRLKTFGYTHVWITGVLAASAKASFRLWARL